MTSNIFQEKLQDVRYKNIGRKEDRKADLMIGLWLELKISITQSGVFRSIRKQEKKLDKFFSDPIILEMFKENEVEAEKALYQEIYDSALKYQQACLDDRSYGSKLFNLIRMKDDELAHKAGKEVYQILIAALLEMDEKIWRNQMIAALHLAHQKTFAQNTINPQYYFAEEELDILDKFNAVIQNTNTYERAE